ncbi:hypothetical protein [Staphylococcus xylosus]|uniref:hypothetical protein n=1 Tax=Staphylococcus xylosus TaxID=1288 RepID=UPI003F57D948
MIYIGDILKYDKVVSAIQALNFESGIYNIVDDESIKDFIGAMVSWLINGNPKTNIQTSELHERGANHAKFHNQDGKLIYPS